jgi:hypothetical protein
VREPYRIVGTAGWDIAKHEVLCLYWGKVGVVVFCILFWTICNSSVLVFTFCWVGGGGGDICFISDNKGTTQPSTVATLIKVLKHNKTTQFYFYTMVIEVLFSKNKIYVYLLSVNVLINKNI